MSRPPGLFVVSTIHPARFFRDATMAFAAQEDWKKAVRVQEEGPTRVHPEIERWQWEPTLRDVLDYLTVAGGSGEEGGPWSIDFEATVDGEPVCMAVWDCTNPRTHRGICVPFLKQGGAQYWSPSERPIVMNIVRDFLRAPYVRKGGQNVVGYDFGFPPWNARALVKKAWGIDVRGIVFDTMVSHHAWLPEVKHGLATQASITTDLPPYKSDLHEKTGESTVEGDNEEDDAEDDWSRVLDKPDEELRVYCLRDAYATAECKSANDAGMAGLHCAEWESFGLAMVPIVSGVGLRGLPFSRSRHTEILAELTREIANIEYRLSVRGITDPSSSKKLGEQLRAAGVPLSKRTGGGQWATDLEVLGRINHDINGAAPEGEEPYPFLADVLRRGRLAKLRAMAVSIGGDPSGNVRKGLCADGKLRTSLKYVATKSARYSSSGFGAYCAVCKVWGERHGCNLQNLPKKREGFPYLRDVVRSERGWLLASLDYKQLELRIQAYKMNCRLLIERLESGMDLHTRHAAIMFGGEDQVYGRRRKLAKNYFFAKRGAGGPRAIQIALAKDEEYVEQSAIREWDAVIEREYPEIPGLIIECEQEIARQQRVTKQVVCRNGFGRPRLMLGHDPLKAYIATMISSTAADMMNAVLDRLARDAAAGKGEAYNYLVLQIHDDFVLYAPERKMQALVRETRDAMQRTFWMWDFAVAFPVDCTAGESWANLQPYDCA